MKSDKKKHPDHLKNNGWIQIPKNEGRLMTNILHVTDEKGAEEIKSHLNDWQLSSFTKGKIGKVGNRVVVFNGIANKIFIGDGGTVIGEDGYRWYHPKNVTPTADYNEVVAIPNEIVMVYDVSNCDDIIQSNDIYKKLVEK
jgi:hypothetical protein